MVRVFENPARQTFVNEMVGGTHLKNAISLNATANNLARAVGPSIGGILIATTGIASAFLFNALSYVATIAMLSLMKDDQLIRNDEAKKKGGDLLSGFLYVWSNKLIRNLLIMMAIVGTFSYEFQVSLPILAQQTFLGNAGDYATLMAAFGVGSVIGGLFAAGRHHVALSHYILAVFLFGVSILGTAVAPTLQAATIGMVIVGIFSINVTSLANTMIQLEAAPEMRGRVMGLWSVAMIGSTPIGGPIIGFIGEHIGARYGLVVGGAAAVLTAAWAFFFLFKQDNEVHGAMAPSEESAEVEVESLKVR
jgi:predicted MFS family arabinose efflux permease